MVYHRGCGNRMSATVAAAAAAVVTSAGAEDYCDVPTERRQPVVIATSASPVNPETKIDLVGVEGDRDILAVERRQPVVIATSASPANPETKITLVDVEGDRDILAVERWQPVVLAPLASPANYAKIATTGRELMVKSPIAGHYSTCVWTTVARESTVTALEYFQHAVVGKAEKHGETSSQCCGPPPSRPIEVTRDDCEMSANLATTRRIIKLNPPVVSVRSQYRARPLIGAPGV